MAASLEGEATSAKGSIRSSESSPFARASARHGSDSRLRAACTHWRAVEVLTPHCAGASCRLTLSVDDGPAVPVRAGRYGLFARPSFENRCTGPTGRRLIPTEIGLTDRGGRIRAWSSEATTACGGPSADYLVWQGR